MRSSGFWSAGDCGDWRPGEDDIAFTLMVVKPGTLLDCVADAVENR
jgi:hypothetical protein